MPEELVAADAPVSVESTSAPAAGVDSASLGDRLSTFADKFEKGESTPAPATEQKPLVTKTAPKFEKPGTSAPETETKPSVEAKAEGQAEDEELIDPDEDLKPDGLSEKGDLFMVRKAKFGRLMGALQFQRKLNEVLPNVTTEQIVAADQRATALHAMEADLLSGEPGNVARFVGHFNRMAPQGVEAMAHVMTSDAFAQANPTAYAAINGRISEKISGDLYEMASKEADKDAQAALLYAAQVIDHKAGRSWKRSAADTTPASDPLADRTAALDAKEREFHNRQNTEAAQKWQTWQNDSMKELTGDLEKTIAGTLEKHIDKNTQALLYEGAESQMGKAIANAYQKNAALQNSIRALTQKAQFSSASERENIRKELRTAYRQFVDSVITANKARIIREAGGVVGEQSESRHAKFAKAAAAKEPTSGGAPTPQSAVSTKITPGMSYEQAADAVFKELNAEFAS
jgi:hypothetical protein